MPFMLTVKLALPPGTVVWFAGWLANDGGTGVVTLARVRSMSSTRSGTPARLIVRRTR